MYVVVTRWEPLPGKSEEFDRTAVQVSDKLRMQPGVMLVESFRRDGRYVAVAIFRDEEAYERIARDPESPFVYILNQAGFEHLGRRVSAEYGSALEHA